jgi:eukaryotic-like serine/threonine-protein kinase
VDVVLSGRYKLISALGQGGMGEVWRGLDTRLNRPVAVKLIRLSAAPSGADYDDAVRRFQREAHAVAALNHPNIVSAYDFGIDAETNMPYLVMEMIEGRPLTAEVAERKAAGQGPLPIGRVLAIATDVCAGLSAAHTAGVIHRDLKPANLMTVTSTGRVKIVDFGTARGDSLTRVTQTGLIVGTVAYIAPEMLMHDEIDGRADIYALGCVLYELLTGRSAYDAADATQFIAAHLHRAPTLLRDLLPEAPEALEALLVDMLAKSPEFRPANAAKVASRLAAALPSIKPITERRGRGRSSSIPAPREPSATLIETRDPAAALAAKPGDGAGAVAELPRRTPTASAIRGVTPVAADASVSAGAAGSADVPKSANPDAGTDTGTDTATAGSDDEETGASAAAGMDDAGTADPSEDADAPDTDIVSTAAASPIPAQRSSRLPVPVVRRPVEPRSWRRFGRVLAIAVAVIVIVAGGIIWVATSIAGHPTASPSTKTTIATKTPTPTPTPAPSTAPGTPAPPAAFVGIRPMTANSACGTPSQLSFNSSGTQLAGAGRSSGGIACVWTVATGALTYKAIGYHKILGAQFNPGNGQLTYAISGGDVPIVVGVVGATGGSIKDSLTNTTHMKSGLEAVAVSSDGHTIAVSYTNSGTIQFYDMTAHHWIVDMSGDIVGSTGTLTFSPNGSRIAHAEPAGVVVVNTASLSPSSKPAKTWSGPGASAAAFLGNDRLITCTGSRISLYDITSATTAPKQSATITGTCVGIAVQSGGHDIAVSTTNGGVALMALPPAWS